MTLRMDPEVRSRWAAALRSGDYHQGTGRLRRRGRNGELYHCCLGVLCELAVAAGVVDVVEERGVHRYVPTGANTWSSTSVLPRVVAEWADLDHVDPLVDGTSLSAWNDHREASFHRIADLLDGTSSS